MSTAPVDRSTLTPERLNAATSDARLAPKKAVVIDAAERRATASSKKEPGTQPTAGGSSLATHCRRRPSTVCPRMPAVRISADKSGDFADVTRTHDRLTPAHSTPHSRWPFCIKNRKPATRDMPEGHSCLNQLRIAPTYRGLPRDGRRGLGPKKRRRCKRGAEHAGRIHR